MVAAVNFNREQEETWLASDEMAKLLGVTVRTIRNMVSRGELERKRMNGKVYVRHPQKTDTEPARSLQAAPELSSHEASLDVFSHPAVVEMVTTLQSQLLRGSQEFAARIQNLNNTLLDERVAKERALAEVGRLSVANQSLQRDLEGERRTVRSEMSNQVRKHNTELTRAVANAATEKAEYRRRIRVGMASMALFFTSLIGLAFGLGALLEGALVIDAARLQFWTAKGSMDPAAWAFWGVTGALFLGGIGWLARLIVRR